MKIQITSAMTDTERTDFAKLLLKTLRAGTEKGLLRWEKKQNEVGIRYYTKIGGIKPYRKNPLLESTISKREFLIEVTLFHNNTGVADDLRGKACLMLGEKSQFQSLYCSWWGNLLNYPTFEEETEPFGLIKQLIELIPSSPLTPSKSLPSTEFRLAIGDYFIMRAMAEVIETLHKHMQFYARGG